MAAVDEQEAKRQKLEEVGAEVEPETPKELEKDADPDRRAKIAEAVRFQLRDCTLNVIPMHGGRVLAPLSDGGLQYLVAAARASAGVKQGRYCFEVKVIELMSPSEPAGGHQRNVPQPRQLLRVGFATQGSSFFLGETAESLCFDSEGFFTADTKREAKGQRIGRDQTVALVLNLDPKSPNKNTVSLFRDGQRCSQPQAIPESMHGKALFPVVNFKNITLQVHFGPTPMVPLPFVCRGMQDMAKEDCAQAPSEAPKDGKFEVVIPVGVPEEGTFEWLDDFMAKNPHYTELSDRAIVKWAEQSGLNRPISNSWKHSNDKPDAKFNIPMMDDFSVRRVLNSVVATQPRNYVVMEVKSNLMANERSELLKRFNFPFYKKVAQVTVGEPASDFKAKVQDALLKEKQEIAEKEWKNRKAEKERKKLFDLQQKKLEEARQKAQKEAEEALKAAESTSAGEAAATATKEETKEEGVKEEAKEEAKDAEMKEESKQDEVKAEAKEESKVEAKVEPKEEEKKAEEEEEEEEEPEPVATLTDEEKAMCFRKKAVPDLTNWVLCTSFAKFSLPQADEGFDQVRYSWAVQEKSEEYFKAWMLRQKIIQKMEELQPGEWFRAKLPEWTRLVSEWHQKQTEWKDPMREAARKAAEEEAKRKEEEEKKAKEAAVEGEKPEGEKPAEGGEQPAEGEKKEEAEEKPKEEKKKVTDIFAVENVCDIGDGEPLFASFSYEDWALLGLRFELYLLVQSFTKDANDPERVGVHDTNLGFYYNKYYRKTLNVKYFGVETNVQLVDMVKDAISVDKDSGVLATQLAEDTPLDMFVKLTEERRRVRQQSLDAGDETARLKFSAAPAPEAMAAPGGMAGGFQDPSASYAYKGGTSKGSYAPARGGAMVPPPPQQQQPWYGGGKGSPYAGFGGKGAVVGGAPGQGMGQGMQQRPCRHWAAGSCQYGARCRFLHA